MLNLRYTLSSILLVALCFVGLLEPLDAQTIFIENFDTEASCAQSGTDNSGNDYTWSSTCQTGDCDPNSTFCGVDNGFGNFEFKNLDDNGGSDTVRWMTQTIPVSRAEYMLFDITVDVQEFGSATFPGYFEVEYSLDDGATWIFFGSVAGNFGQRTFTETEVMFDADVDVIVQVTATNLSNQVMVINEVTIGNAILSEDALDLVAVDHAAGVELVGSSSINHQTGYYMLERSSGPSRYVSVQQWEASSILSGRTLRHVDTYRSTETVKYRLVYYHDGEPPSYSTTVLYRSDASPRSKFVIISHRVYSSIISDETSVFQILDINGSIISESYGRDISWLSLPSLPGAYVLHYRSSTEMISRLIVL